MLTESQAWEWIAKKWKSPKKVGKVRYIEVTDGYTQSYGICGIIRELFRLRLISIDLKDKMSSVIYELPCKSSYKWPLTAAGAKKRVAFCLMMAKKTGDKKGKHVD